jgi:hypothetical protein
VDESQRLSVKSDRSTSQELRGYTIVSGNAAR